MLSDLEIRFRYTSFVSVPPPISLFDMHHSNPGDFKILLAGRAAEDRYAMSRLEFFISPP